MTKKMVALCACPMGLAHTFMAAEAIEVEAKNRGCLLYTSRCV